METVLHKVRHKVQRWSYRNVYYDQQDLKYTVFLAGSARSGTTWILDIIRASGNFRTLFEPLHFKNSIHGRAFFPYEYLRFSDGNNEQLQALTSVIRGKVRGAWENQDNRCLFPNRRLIKDIHSNLRIGWIQKHFPDMHVVFLIRNPAEVARSRLKLGWHGQEVVSRIQAQSKLLEDFPEIKTALRYLSQRHDDPLSSSILLWCIQQKVALSQLNPDTCIVLAYEDFVTNAQQSTLQLYRRLGLAPHLPQSFDFQQYSRTSKRPSSHQLCDEKQPEPLSDAASHLLEVFDLARLYNENGQPQIDFASLPSYFNLIESIL